MSAVLLGGLEVISLRLSLPLRGVWTAEAEMDAHEIATGPASITMAVEGSTPIAFIGTLIEARSFEGRARAFVVGGTGGLRRPLVPRQYQLAPPHVIAEAVIREAGEHVGDLSGLHALMPLRRWIRSAGTAGFALSRLCERLGVAWRMGRDGAIRAGLETWPSFGGNVEAIEENGAHGRIVVARDAPDLVPGVAVEGRRIGRVVHIVREGGAFRTEVHFEGMS